MKECRLVGAPAQHKCDVGPSRVELEPPGSFHHAKVICGCGGFLRWLPNPRSIQLRVLNVRRIAHLQKCEGLSAWERDFLASIARLKGKLSPRQEAVLGRLYREYLGLGGAA
jgi:hypothetical protein